MLLCTRSLFEQHRDHPPTDTATRQKRKRITRAVYGVRVHNHYLHFFDPFLLSYINLIIHGCIEIETQFAYIPDAMSTRLLSLFMQQWARYVHESMTWTFVFVIMFAQLAQIVNYNIHCSALTL